MTAVLESSDTNNKVQQMEHQFQLFSRNVYVVNNELHEGALGFI